MSEALATALLAERLVSRRAGLVRALRERRTSDGFRVIDVVAELRSRPGGGAGAEVNGGGCFTRERAQAAAIGEGVERHCLGVYDAQHLGRATPAELAPLACSAEELRFFTDGQYAQPGFPYPRVDERSRLRWAEGYSVARSGPVWLPASLVYLPYAYQAGEPPLGAQLSTGTSCHRSVAAATLRALMEVVERDALTILWESQTAFPPVDAEQVAQAARTCAGRAPVQLYAFDLSTDVAIPVVLALAVCPGQEPEVAIGVAAHVDGELALARAVEECITSWRSSLFLCRGDRSSRAELLHALTTAPEQRHHALYHGRVGALAGFDFLLGSGLAPRRMCGGVPAAELLPRGLAALLAAGLDVVLYDLSLPDLRDLGLHVVRVVVTGLVRQTVGMVVRHLRNPRILGVPAALGLAAGRRDAADLLARPVPFP